MGTHVSHDRHASTTMLGETTPPSASSPPVDRPSAVPGASHIQGMVAEFHQIYGCATDVPLNIAMDELIDLRIDLIQEELEEVFAAIRSTDVLAIARELADLAYVVAGTAVAFGLEIPPREPLLGSLSADCGKAFVSLTLRSTDLVSDLSRLLATIYRYADMFGIDLDKAVTEVHRANLSKLGDDGRPILRADGKVLKGPRYAAPDMAAAIGFTVPTNGHQPPPWWLDGMGTH